MGNLIEDRREVWRYRHAQYCFDQTIQTHEELLKLKWSEDHPLYLQLSIAVCVLYARPFSKNYGLDALGDDLVPSALLGRHRKIIALRDKVYAHHDTKDFADPEMIAQMPKIRMLCLRNQQILEFAEYPLKYEAFKQAAELAEILRKKCEWRLQKIMNRYRREFAVVPRTLHLYLKSDAKTLFETSDRDETWTI